MLDKELLSYIKQIGLSYQDYLDTKNLLRRKPKKTELALFSAMWSEHCSYKSSKFWLKKLPTRQDPYCASGR